MDSITAFPSVPQEGTGPKYECTDNFLIDRKDSNESAAEACQDSQINKYKWPEFTGFAGERYLESILQSILPFALFRTWHNLTIREAPGQGAYAGVTRIATVSSRCERKIYQDLADLSERGLLEMSKAWRTMVTADGTPRMQLVTLKNFERLYDLAHEFHLWSQDPFYIAPQRENAEFIIQDATLFQKLLRFECYRKILLLRKPGPKVQPRQRWYNKTIDELLTTAQSILHGDAEDAGYGKSADEEAILQKQLSEQLPKHSVYRNTSTENFDRDRSPKVSTSEKGTVYPPQTIRSATEQSSNIDHTATHHLPSTESKSKPNKTRQERGAAAAKDSEEYLGYNEYELKHDVKKRGAAAIGVTAEQYRKLQGGQDQRELEEQRERERAAQAQASRQERERPAQVESTIEQYVRQYDDPELIQSDITRGLKLYFTAEEVLQHFSPTLFWNVFDQAKAAAAKYANKNTNRQGRVNRVPYLFTCMENAFRFSLEELVYLRTEDPLYTEYSHWDVIDTLEATYQHQRQHRQTVLDYRGWLLDILDRLENRAEPRTRTNPTKREYEGEAL